MFHDVLFGSALLLVLMKDINIYSLWLLSGSAVAAILKRISRAYLIVLPIAGILLWILSKEKDLIFASLIVTFFLVFSDFESERSKVYSLVFFFVLSLIFEKNPSSFLFASGTMALFFLYEKKFLYASVVPLLAFVPEFRLPFLLPETHQPESGVSVQQMVRNVVVVIEKFTQSGSSAMKLLWEVIFWVAVAGVVLLVAVFFKEFRMNLKVSHYVLAALGVFVVSFYLFVLFVNMVVQNVNLDVGIPELTPVGQMLSSTPSASVTIVEIERNPSWNLVRWILTVVSLFVALLFFHTTLKLFLRTLKTSSEEIETEESREEEKEDVEKKEHRTERKEIHTLEDAYLFLRWKYFPGKEHLTPYELISGKKFRHFRGLTELYVESKYAGKGIKLPEKEIAKIFSESEKELKKANINPQKNLH
ncbi:MULTISPECIES: hypothetical protein [unclassified Thermotoga]|uniref:hypothetical protein n=2 Tax=Thermotoga TaxID=2335 RepID=UPI0001600BB6|nr:MULTISPECIES: hypothetical protein [unclassified Thermotoga]ACB10012.1 conserved hypothetical protein [Thermotoga sp. RQ2]KHC91563.1 hypothetical protein Mc24_05875 [Thermotoga sp. Mc24]KHC93080.1 hypothetical protein TBGT1765_03637 [Thermotoga sp. TBGT1765]KHC94488.1 hypothetical protein TBGT1766_03314 [Thermotoga sp. TBGT1766]KHC95571.1 hypothetical protein XYL54_06701 [Thermotoga sp. Xyl54]